MRRTVRDEAIADDLRRAYEKNWQALVQLCALLVRDAATAEDIVQDVFIRARDHLAGLSDEATHSYLRRATVNEWKNWLRSRDTEHRAHARLTPARLEEANEADERDAIWHAIVRLPERQRAVLVLRYYEDLSDRDIARLLGCAQVTVRTQAKRALARLREAIGE